MVRVPPTELEPIDAWIKAQPKPRPSRPEAIRRLVEIGLMVSAKKSRPDKTMKDSDGRIIPPEPTARPGRRARAQELAATAIDKMHDPAASTEERDERHRRLTKGPPEFREVRVDRPKAKK